MSQCQSSQGSILITQTCWLVKIRVITGVRTSIMNVRSQGIEKIKLSKCVGKRFTKETGYADTSLSSNRVPVVQPGHLLRECLVQTFFCMKQAY